jgi:pimeloyl-ACP methyl ester carboxylesterase
MIRSLPLRLAAIALVPTMAMAMATAASAAGTTAPAQVTLDHISIVKLGSGPPVVLIPGLGSPRAAWDGVAPALARNHSVYLVQVNGFGGDAPGANLKPGILDGIVSDLSTYLAREKSGPVRLAGHSMGGLAAMMFARAHPKQVERLMIVDALPYFPALLAGGGPEPRPNQVAPVAKMMRDTVAARFGKPVDPATIDADVKGLSLKAESRATTAKWAATADPRVTAQLLFEDMSTDMRPHLSSLTMPITVIVPWSETGFGKERTLAFYRRQFATAPTVAFVDIADAGHMVMLDQPAAFAAAMADFAD